MRTVTATEASRNFKKLLDAVESGESVAITRGGETIAEIRPKKRYTGKDLRLVLEKLDREPVSDEEHEAFKRAIEETREFMIDDWENRIWLGD